jgi:hypothetical protein
VKNLNLSNCTNITDVSGLKNVSKLILTGCTGVTDTSMLTCQIYYI